MRRRRTTLSITLTAQVMEELNRRAEASGLSRSAYIDQLLRKLFKEEENAEGN